MSRRFAEAAQDTRGAAGIEFMLVAPVLILLFVGLADFALAYWYKKALASSVAEGAGYAVLAGPTVNAPAIQGIVGRKLALQASSITVTGPTCYCMSGMPAVSTVQTCGAPCPDGVNPGSYVTISAQYTYKAMLASYSQLASPLFTETAMGRLR